MFQGMLDVVGYAKNAKTCSSSDPFLRVVFEASNLERCSTAFQAKSRLTSACYKKIENVLSSVLFSCDANLLYTEYLPGALEGRCTVTDLILCCFLCHG